jgi:hypothetical protein
MDSRQERAGRNEALFREVNERLESLNETFSALTNTFQVVCECDKTDCIKQIDVTRGTYEEVRADAAQFFVVPGHEDPAAESVVARTDAYLIVRKHPGRAEQLAVETDPRS